MLGWLEILNINKLNKLSFFEGIWSQFTAMATVTIQAAGHSMCENGTK
jgi:hypothetical protein